jgi:hypothetical protein
LDDHLAPRRMTQRRLEPIERIAVAAIAILLAVGAAVITHDVLKALHQ